MVQKSRQPAILESAAAAAAATSTSTHDLNMDLISVTAQQSRYAVDAVDAPASKEIYIRDLSITLGTRSLLTRTTLHLVEGRHYVLVGRNGTGKSTLLRAIGGGLVPGIAASTRVLLLGQTGSGWLDDDDDDDDDDYEEEEKVNGLQERKDETVLQFVLRSDSARERLQREARVLAAAIDNAGDAVAAVRAYRRVRVARVKQSLKQGHRIAERRSGARGKTARKEVLKLEAQYDEALRAAGEDEHEMDAASVSTDIQAAADLLAGVQAELEMMDAEAAEARARRVLLGLGFKTQRIEGPRAQLSGGWQTRCELACALTQYADVLLLDEPTNFLDLPSILWLQDYINNMMDTTVLMTTHDRDFGDAVAEELLLLRDEKLETFRGNLSLYEREKHKKIKYLSKMKDAKDKQKKHIEKSIASNIKAARDKGDDKKLKQAASRQKKLDERWGVEVGLKGGRFKLNRDLGGYHLTGRAEIEIPDFEAPVKLTFPRQPPDLRFPGALVSLEKVTFWYAGRKQAPVLKDVSLTIHPGTRTGVAGLNGSGKTTLVSLISGDLAPCSGSITRHARARIGRFSQQSVEEISAIAATDGRLTALRHVMETAGGEMEEKEARQVLGSLGLHGQTVSDVPLGLLSGGQKVRVALAKLLWPPPQLLILDEVTTHLDSDTILGLVVALGEYDGALLVITHDRFFMRTVVEGASPYELAAGVGGEDEADESESEGEAAGARAGTVYRVRQGQLVRVEGGMQQYGELAARAAGRLEQTV